MGTHILPSEQNVEKPSFARDCTSLGRKLLLTLHLNLILHSKPCLVLLIVIVLIVARHATAQAANVLVARSDVGLKKKKEKILYFNMTYFQSSLNKTTRLEI